jgi:hypothetical protein
MKETVGQRVGLKPDHGARRVITCARQQVMPLQDLMKQDPVKETAESDPEQDASAKSRRARTGRLCDLSLGHLAESGFRLGLSQPTRLTVAVTRAPPSEQPSGVMASDGNGEGLVEKVVDKVT